VRLGRAEVPRQPVGCMRDWDTDAERHNKPRAQRTHHGHRRQRQALRCRRLRWGAGIPPAAIIYRRAGVRGAKRRGSAGTGGTTCKATWWGAGAKPRPQVFPVTLHSPTSPRARLQVSEGTRLGHIDGRSRNYIIVPFRWEGFGGRTTGAARGRGLSNMTAALEGVAMAQ
jgi:hypothetical protein